VKQRERPDKAVSVINAAPVRPGKEAQGWLSIASHQGSRVQGSRRWNETGERKCEGGMNGSRINPWV